MFPRLFIYDHTPYFKIFNELTDIYCRLNKFSWFCVCVNSVMLRMRNMLWSYGGVMILQESFPCNSFKISVSVCLVFLSMLSSINQILSTPKYQIINRTPFFRNLLGSKKKKHKNTTANKLRRTFSVK